MLSTSRRKDGPLLERLPPYAGTAVERQCRQCFGSMKPQHLALKQRCQFVVITKTQRFSSGQYDQHQAIFGVQHQAIFGVAVQRADISLIYPIIAARLPASDMPGAAISRKFCQWIGNIAINLGLGPCNA